VSDWTDRLQPASWRGVPFAVTEGTSRFGRKQAIHDYPFRDQVWIEDLGRAPRRISITGFLIEDSLIYGGGDVLLQKEAMIAAAETAGPGTLVHPTLGVLTLSLLEPVEILERKDLGLAFGLRFSLIEAGQRVFPSTSTSTQDQTNTAAGDASAAFAGDFGDEMAG
jgi:prophage DNA circulation protein